MGVGNQRVVVREIALPAMPEKELRQSLGFQVQEFIPMPVDEAVLDYHLIEELEVEGRQMLRLLLVAAQKAMVDTLVTSATNAKLEPMGLDLVPFAMVRAGRLRRGHGPRAHRRRGRRRRGRPRHQHRGPRSGRDPVRADPAVRGS